MESEMISMRYVCRMHSIHEDYADAVREKRVIDRYVDYDSDAVIVSAIVDGKRVSRVIIEEGC